ncbi:MAG: hypothetical protein DRN25_04320 [Thermoplasmata archaeon]|nr:MAG: hypothetical protein DRN25_04320 [Thermoplasmata archaeon]
MDRKSVSPIISVVLLIGIAVAAAALVFTWYTGMQKGAQEAAGEGAGRAVRSASASLLITNVEYNSSGENYLNVTVVNIGSVTLTNLTVYMDSSLLTLHDDCKENAYSLAKEGVTYLWNQTEIKKGVHTIKVVSREGAQATYTLVI